ncbi:MAG TPA: hypothetical protein VE944_09790 [Nostoc sp.]|uniref:hypothetical protein n=1 Tax=Nostoc sp. TaxID=1180 RepID=UPI002D3C3730|nr:hypothetical protein [Nostoc sp.]HYX14643.1 hypothetical protein [Nostoc sp.]
MEKSATGENRRNCEKALFRANSSSFKPKYQALCQHCGGEFRLKVVSDRRRGTKYLRAGCCDAALRPCPDPVELMRSPKLTLDERQFLQRLIGLEWFSGQVAAVLLQIEDKAKASGEVSA